MTPAGRASRRNYPYILCTCARTSVCDVLRTHFGYGSSSFVTRASSAVAPYILVVCLVVLSLPAAIATRGKSLWISFVLCRPRRLVRWLSRVRSYKNRRPDDGVALIDFGRLSRAMYCCYLISKITVTHRTRTRDVVTSSNTDMRTIRVGPTSPGDELPVENGCKKTFTTGTRDVFYGLINSKNGKRSSFNRYVTVKGERCSSNKLMFLYDQRRSNALRIIDNNAFISIPSGVYGGLGDRTGFWNRIRTDPTGTRQNLPHRRSTRGLGTETGNRVLFPAVREKTLHFQES